MLIMMNGYSERDATPGLIAYLVLGVVTVLIASTAASLGTHALIKRAYNGALAASISTAGLSVVAAAFIMLWAIAGIAIAEYVRVNR